MRQCFWRFTPISAIPDVIENRITGLLVNMRDERAIASAILKLNKKLTKSIKRSVKEKIKKKSVEKCTERLREVFINNI